MKKKMLIFMSILILYNFEISAFASSDFFDEEDLITEIEFLPVVYATPQLYSSSATVALVSQVVGGSTVLAGSSALVTALLGAGAIALTVGGIYVVGQGLSNLYDYAKDWSVTQSQLAALNNFNAIFDDLGNLTLSTTVSSSVVSNTISGFVEKLGTAGTTSKNHFEINYPAGIISLSNNRHFFANRNGYSYNPSWNQWLMSTFNGSTYIYQYIELSHVDSYTPKYIVRNVYQSTVFGYEKISDFSVNVTLNSDYIYNLTDTFGDIIPLTTSQKNSLIDSTVYSKPIDLVIPNKYIGVFNPGFSWENGNWVDKNGVTQDIQDMVIPFPNTLGGDRGFSYSDELDSAITDSVGDSTLPGDDSVTLPSGIIGFLQSILDWLIDFPSWLVTNLVDVITGAISSATNFLSKIWSWCQDLPNILADWFAGIIEFLQSIGLTLADILAGIISLPSDLVGFLIDALIYLFIPVDGFFISELSSLGDIFTSKIPFFGQLGNLLKAFKFDINAALPKFEITLPNSYGGTTHQIIDFAYFVDYRTTILNFIRLFSWIPFLIKIYKKSIYMATGD